MGRAQGNIEDKGVVPIINNHSFFSAEDVESLIETPSQCHLINSSLPLHPVLYPKLPLRLSIGEIESSQALRTRTFGVRGWLYMSLLGSGWFLGGFEVHGADGALAEMPVLDVWHAMN